MTEYAVIDGQRVEMTDWFHGNIKPSQPGVYRVKAVGASRYRYWNGVFWFYGGDRIVDAARTARTQANIVPNAQIERMKWRGLSHPPGAT